MQDLALVCCRPRPRPVNVGRRLELLKAGTLATFAARGERGQKDPGYGIFRAPPIISWRVLQTTSRVFPVVPKSRYQSHNMRGSAHQCALEAMAKGISRGYADSSNAV